MPTFESGFAVVDAIAAEFKVRPVELRWFAQSHLNEGWPAGQGISSSDVSHHLSELGNYQPELLRAEAERLAERNVLVQKVVDSTGKTFDEALASLQEMFAPVED